MGDTPYGGLKAPPFGEIPLETAPAQGGGVWQTYFRAKTRDKSRNDCLSLICCGNNERGSLWTFTPTPPHGAWKSTISCLQQVFHLSLYLIFLFLLTNCRFHKTSERAALLKRKCLKPAWLQGEPCWRLKSAGEKTVFFPVVQNPKDVEIKPSEKLLKWETGTRATERQSKPQEAPSKQNHMAISAKPSRDGFFSYPAPACVLSKRLVAVPSSIEASQVTCPKR